MTNINNLEDMYRKLEDEINECVCYTDTLRIYCNLSKLPLLSKEKERILLIETKKGDKRARDILVKRNIGLVKSIANRHMQNGLSILDLIQEGIIGLMIAIKKFDLSKNVVLSTYAYPYIERNIEIAILSKSRIISIPINKFTEFKKYIKFCYELQSKLNREPSINEISEYLNIDMDKVKEFERLRYDACCFSLLQTSDDSDFYDYYINDDATNLEDDVINKLYAKNVCERLMEEACLTEKQTEVIKYLYGIDGYQECNQSAIAKKLLLSVQSVSEIKKKAKKKLYEAADNFSFNE